MMVNKIWFVTLIFVFVTISNVGAWNLTVYSHDTNNKIGETGVISFADGGGRILSYKDVGKGNVVTVSVPGNAKYVIFSQKGNVGDKINLGRNSGIQDIDLIGRFYDEWALNELNGHDPHVWMQVRFYDVGMAVKIDYLDIWDGNRLVFRAADSYGGWKNWKRARVVYDSYGGVITVYELK